MGRRGTDTKRRGAGKPERADLHVIGKRLAKKVQNTLLRGVYMLRLSGII